MSLHSVELWEVLRRLAGCTCHQWSVSRVRFQPTEPALTHLLTVHLSSLGPWPENDESSGERRAA
jgi:hypothetical protein